MYLTIVETIVYSRESCSKTTPFEQIAPSHCIYVLSHLLNSSVGLGITTGYLYLLRKKIMNSDTNLISFEQIVAPFFSD